MAKAAASDYAASTSVVVADTLRWNRGGAPNAAALPPPCPSATPRREGRGPGKRQRAVLRQRLLAQPERAVAAPQPAPLTAPSPAQSRTTYSGNVPAQSSYAIPAAENAYGSAYARQRE